MEKTFDIEIKGIDLDLLREQKKQLLFLQGRTNTDNSPLLKPGEFDAIDGIINMIDAIQDAAVEQHQLDEEEVFKFSNE